MIYCRLMNHAVPLYLFPSLLVEICAIPILFIIWLRNRQRLLLLFFLLMFSLTILTISIFILSYFSTNISPSVSIVIFGFILYNGVVTGFIFTLFVLLAHEVSTFSFTRKGSRIAIASSALLIVSSEIFRIISYDWSSSSLESQLFLPLYHVIYFGSIVYALVISLVSYPRIKNAYIKRATFFMIILSTAFLPGFTCDFFVDQISYHAASISTGFFFFPFYGLILGICSVILGIKYLIGDVNAQLPTPVEESESNLLARMRMEFGLSEREAEIVSLLYRGMSNKRIASSLSISTRTAENHIYNLYQKLGINSRYELLALRNKKRPARTDDSPA